MKRKPAKERKLKIVYKQATDLSEKEMQQRLDNAFDILFDEVLKNKAREKRH